MYQVLINCDVLYDPTLSGYEIFFPKAQLEVNKVGRFDFKIYPKHPAYNKIKKLVSVIEVFQNGVLIFRGRPLDDDIDFDNGKKIICESDLAFLNDSIVRPYQFTGGVSEFLNFCLVAHNEQVEVSKQFTLGTVTVSDPNDYIVRANNEYTSSLETITTKLVNMLGGYLYVRRVGGINYLDYLEDSTYRSDQVIELGDNLLNLNKTLKGSVICTALIPTGATIANEDPNLPDTVVDITSVNDNVDYVYDQAAVDRFGWIYKHVSYSDITIPTNLKNRAIRELSQITSYIENIEITAIDKSMISLDFHRFRIFEYVKVVSEPHGLDEFYLIKKQTINLTDPKNNTITIGAERKTLTDSNVNIRDELNVIRNETITNNNKITETYKELSNTITETAETFSREIREEVSSEMDEMREETSTLFKQTKDEFYFQFKSILDQVEDLDDETRGKFEEIVKYIRFIDGNIVLGDVNNKLELILTSERMSFYQDGTELAYFANNRFYVKDGEFTNVLKIGNFAFMPRSNGNLSFRLFNEEGG